MALYAYVEKLFEEYDGVFNLFPQDLEEDDPSVIEESSAASEGSRADIRNDFVEQQTDVAEQQSNTQESAEKLEDRIIKDSPYADHDEDPAPATEEAGPAAMQRHNRTDSKAGLKRHLADVSSFEFGNNKPATPFFWHVPKVIYLFSSLNSYWQLNYNSPFFGRLEELPFKTCTGAWV